MARIQKRGRMYVVIFFFDGRPKREVFRDAKTANFFKRAIEKDRRVR